MDDLLDVMREARRLAASDELLLYEIDGHIRALLKGGGNRVGMTVLFLPTGPLQELSLDEGWGDEFCALADRFDVAVRAYGHYCAVCSKLAGTLVVEGNELRRESFTSTLTQPIAASARAALGDAGDSTRSTPNSRRSTARPAMRLTAATTGAPTTSSRMGYTIRSVAHVRSVMTGCWKIRLLEQQMAVRWA